MSERPAPKSRVPKDPRAELPVHRKIYGPRVSNIECPGTASDSLLPPYINVYPKLAQAALSAGEHSPFASHALLRAGSTTFDGGSGILARSSALAVLGEGRALGLRQVQRLLHEGDDLYWDLMEERLLLYGPGRIGKRLGVESVGLPHRIPTPEFSNGLAAIRSTFIATEYRTDEQDVPKSRRLVQELTGVPGSTQRRYDSTFGHAKRVQAISVTFPTSSPWYSGMFAKTYRHFGFFAGRDGGCCAATHQPGSRAASRRVNRELRNESRPAIQARGQRLPRATFRDRQGGVRGWLRAKLAFGKRGAERTAVHPILNYALVQVRTLRGRLRWEALREPDT